MRILHVSFLLACCLSLILISGCGDDADDFGVGAQCSATSDCADGQQCLTQFKGGYCGLTGCKANTDCPDNSACIAHTDGKDYCFRVCTDKVQCNTNRTKDTESNCSSKVTFVSGKKESKVCVPPSS